jgi:hypothetical protein
MSAFDLGGFLVMSVAWGLVCLTSLSCIQMLNSAAARLGQKQQQRSPIQDVRKQLCCCPCCQVAFYAGETRIISPDQAGLSPFTKNR